MKIACVYKTGGDFDSDYVETLYDSLHQYGDFVCFTDGDVPDHIPQQRLKHGWKGWWSKIEMLGYDDDLLFFDLDTVIVGNLERMMYVARKWDKMIMLSDFYRPQNPASGVMYIPNVVGNSLYETFKQKPDAYISKFRGDQDFIACFWKEIDRWDEVLDKDYICSYKAHIAKTAPRHMNIQPVNTENSKIISFHGKPRVKDIPEKWDIKN